MNASHARFLLPVFAVFWFAIAPGAWPASAQDDVPRPSLVEEQRASDAAAQVVEDQRASDAAVQVVVDRSLSNSGRNDDPNPRQQADNLESEVMRIAREARQLRDGGPETAKTYEQKQSELKQMVQQVYELRMTIQQQEIDTLTKRLEAVRESIERRRKIKTELIEERVASLLDPNLIPDVAPAAVPRAIPRIRVVTEHRIGPDGKVIKHTRHVPVVEYVQEVEERRVGSPRRTVREGSATIFPEGEPPAADDAPKPSTNDSSDAKPNSGQDPATVFPVFPGLAPNRGASRPDASWPPGPKLDPMPSSDPNTRVPSHSLPDSSLAPALNNLSQTRKAMIDYESQLEEASATLDRLKGVGQAVPKSKIEQAERAVAQAQRHRERVRRDYSAQIELLKLEVALTTAALDQAHAQLRRVQELFQKRVVSQTEALKAEAAVREAEIRRSYAKKLLELHEQSN